jgi:hypothetical protein
MSTLPDNEFDLEKLFLPAWAQEPSSAKYAHYEGEEQRVERRGERRGPRPPRREGPAPQRREENRPRRAAGRPGTRAAGTGRVPAAAARSATPSLESSANRRRPCRRSTSL